MENEDINSLKDEIQILKDELASLKEEKHGFDFASKIEEIEVLKDFQEDFSKIKDKTEDMTSDLKEHILKNPIKSVSMAFGIGLLLSKVLGGRR